MYYHPTITPTKVTCVPEFEELVLRLMLADNLTFPANIEEVRQLYDNLLSYNSVIENP